MLINEVNVDTPGTTSMDFVELYDGGKGNSPLDGLILVFFNGANQDRSYLEVDLNEERYGHKEILLFTRPAALKRIFGTVLLMLHHESVSVGLFYICDSTWANEADVDKSHLNLVNNCAARSKFVKFLIMASDDLRHLFYKVHVLVVWKHGQKSLFPCYVVCLPHWLAHKMKLWTA